MTAFNINIPGRYVPAMAMCYAAVDGTSVLASMSAPLPVQITGGDTTSLADQTMVDATGTYWLVRDNGTALTYTNWTTGLSGTPQAPLLPASGTAGSQVLAAPYNALNASSAYASGDALEHIVVLGTNGVTVSVAASAWINITQGTVLTSAPAASDIAASIGSAVTTTLATMAAQHWALGAVLNLSAYASVRVQIDTLSGDDTITFAGSLASGGVTYGWLAYDQSGTACNAITAPGIYTLPGRGYLTALHTGTASSPVLTVATNQ